MSTAVEWDQLQLWQDDSVDVQVRFSHLAGWEWTVRSRQNGQWGLLDSGTASSPQNALVRAADVLVDIAIGWDGF